jgi:hypothetical protein
MHELEGGGVDGVAAEIAQEVFVFFEDDDVDAGAGEEQAEHYASGAAAGDATLDFEYVLRHPLYSVRKTMSLRINDEAPNFSAETTHGPITFHEWIGNGWAILFSHPKDFTPVCTTELGYMARLSPEFAKRNTKIIGLSVDPVTSHGKWAADIEETQGRKVNYPMNRRSRIESGEAV